MRDRPRYAVRLNAYPGADLDARLARAATAGLDAADLNYPDHLRGLTPAGAKAALDWHGIGLNGLAMRYGGDPAMRLGAFTHPDRAVRRRAIDLTRAGLDALGDMGGGTMTLWLGQDGVDYSFQGDYARMWDDTVAALAEVADHAPGTDIAVEYKPNEPRAHASLPTLGMTLLALADAGRENLGVTLDFCHVLFAGEIPAQVAALAARRSRLMGVHLNDGYGKRDDGLIAGSVHPVQTVELFVELIRQDWRGTIYFDTFPDHGGTDPVAESRANVAMAERLRAVALAAADDPALAAATARQDAPAALAALSRHLYR